MTLPLSDCACGWCDDRRRALRFAAWRPAAVVGLLFMRCAAVLFVLALLCLAGCSENEQRTAGAAVAAGCVFLGYCVGRAQGERW